MKMNIFCIFIILQSIMFGNFNNTINLEKKINIESIEYIASSKTISLVLNIPDGYYAYIKSKIANKINISSADKSKLDFKVKYPQSIKYKDNLIIYGKQIFELKLSKEIASGDYDIILSYQLCKEADNICLSPEEKIINFSVDDNKLINLNYIDNLPKNIQAIEDNNSLVSKIKNNNNILLTIILIFLAGIASILLPCTYPLISITISLIGIDDKNGNRDTKQSIISSALFSLGIITTYTLLGAIVSVAGSIFNKDILFGSIGYNPFVIGVIVILFLYFTFSMAGFYDIKVPSFLNKIKNNAYGKNKNSILYKYIIGLITGVVATPCAAPVIALILEIGFLNPTYAIIYMATYALGFSLVLFILSIFLSVAIKKLPKAGEWMNYIRLLFSFIMLLVSYYYLEILLKNIGLIKVSPLVAGLIIFVISFLTFFILNKKEKISLSLKELKIFFTMLVIGVIIATTYTTIKDSTITKETISLKHAIELSKNDDKKILIDFSAVWCENCYQLEKNVLNSTIMKNYLEDNNYILVKVDIDKNKDIVKEFSVKWLPWMIVIDNNKNILYTKNSFDSFDDKMVVQIINELKNIK